MARWGRYLGGEFRRTVAGSGRGVDLPREGATGGLPGGAEDHSSGLASVHSAV